jgi:hypothetical protein
MEHLCSNIVRWKVPVDLMRPLLYIHRIRLESFEWYSPYWALIPGKLIIIPKILRRRFLSDLTTNGTIFCGVDK